MMENGSSTIYAEGLIKDFGRRRVLNEVDLEVKSGEVVGLLGPNGAGKTTSFYIIVGLLESTGGRVWLDGRDITRVPMYKRARMGIGYLPQEHSVFAKLTVEENIRAVAETLPLSRAERAETVERHLNELNLTPLARQKAYTLSGGEKRRLEITRALVTNPRFLLMDEPFANIDPISVNEVQTIIGSLVKKGIGVLITDHSVREILEIVDRAYLMHEGRVLCEGSSDFLLNDPQSRRLYLGEKFNL